MRGGECNKCMHIPHVRAREYVWHRPCQPLLSDGSSQVLGRWCVQHGFIAIPKSVKEARMAENLQVFDFELSADDMATLDGMTTPEAIAKFVELYRKCVVRDTPVPADQAKTQITEA